MTQGRSVSHTPRITQSKRSKKHYKRFMWGKIGNVLASALLCFDLWKSCLDLWGTDSQCEVQLPWPVRNRLTVRRRIALTHKEQTHGARDFVNEFPWPTRNRLVERGTLWMNFPDPQGTDLWCEDLMDKDYLTAAFTCEEQTHSAKTNCPDPQGTDSWSEGLCEWISLTHKEQTCGARDLMDKDYLMTVLTREDLTHGAKTGVDELTDVFMGGKVYGLEWHSPPRKPTCWFPNIDAWRQWKQESVWVILGEQSEENLSSCCCMNSAAVRNMPEWDCTFRSDWFSHVVFKKEWIPEVNFFYFCVCGYVIFNVIRVWRCW